jgi:hypothetical protein
MEQYHNGINNNNNPDKKTAIESNIYLRFITTIALPTVLLILTFTAAVPISPVQATGGGGNETAASPAPSGASLGPATNETNVTTTAAQSACLPQNTTTGRPAAVDANATTTTDNTTATVAPSGASIGANDTSTSLAPAGNTTTDNTTATVAPSGASIC